MDDPKESVDDLCGSLPGLWRAGSASRPAARQGRSRTRSSSSSPYGESVDDPKGSVDDLRGSWLGMWLTGSVGLAELELELLELEWSWAKLGGA